MGERVGDIVGDNVGGAGEGVGAAWPCFLRYASAFSLILVAFFGFGGCLGS